MLDDSLPMPPDQREARDDAELAEPERSERRRLRLRIRRYEKEGKGGYR
jgi:hypothetical protein